MTDTLVRCINVIMVVVILVLAALAGIQFVTWLINKLNSASLIVAMGVFLLFGTIYISFKK